MKTKLIECLKKKVLLVEGLPDGLIELKKTVGGVVLGIEVFEAEWMNLTQEII